MDPKTFFSFVGGTEPPFRANLLFGISRRCAGLEQGAPKLKSTKSCLDLQGCDSMYDYDYVCVYAMFMFMVSMCMSS